MKYDVNSTSGKGWYRLNKGDVHRGIIDAARSIDDHPNEIKRFNEYLAFRRRYDTHHWWIERGGSRGRGSDICQWNVVKSIVDTGVSQVAASRTQVMALTRQGDSRMQRRAKTMSMFFDGQFERCGQADLRQDVARTGMICGTGVQMVVPSWDHKTIETRHVVPVDIAVPVREGRTGKPTFLLHHDEVPTSHLLDLFPGKASIIESATYLREQSRRRDDIGVKEGPDEITPIIRAYKLPTPGKANGRYVVAVSDGTLIDKQDWDGTRLPYSFYRWLKRDDDFWGIGLVQDIDSVQEELDHLSWKVQAHMKVATTQIWTRKGSTVAKEAAGSNLIFARNTFTVDPPITINQQPIDPSFFAERGTLWQKAYDISGISPMNATGQMPAGVQAGSGKAIRLYKDIAAGRIKPQQDRLDQATVEAATLMVHAAREIAANGDGTYEVMAKSKKGLIAISWDEVDTPEEDYQLQYFPTSFLSQMPTGRLDDIADLTKTFPQLAPYAMKYMDFPDIEAMMQLATSEFDAVLMAIDAICEDGIYMGPDAQTKPEVAMPLVLAAYHRAQVNQEDEDRLEMLRDYMMALKRLTDEAKAAAAPPPGPMPEGPPMDAPIGLPPGPMPGAV